MVGERWTKNALIRRRFKSNLFLRILATTPPEQEVYRAIRSFLLSPPKKTLRSLIFICSLTNRSRNRPSSCPPTSITWRRYVSNHSILLSHEPRKAGRQSLSEACQERGPLQRACLHFNRQEASTKEWTTDRERLGGLNFFVAKVRGAFKKRNWGG